MIKNYIEVPFPNGFKVVIGKGSDVVISLENPNGYIVSDTSLTKEEVEKLKEILILFDK